MPDEIDLNEEEEAALDRAWARIHAQNEAKRQANGGKDEDEEEPEPDEVEEGE